MIRANFRPVVIATALSVSCATPKGAETEDATDEASPSTASEASPAPVDAHAPAPAPAPAAAAPPAPAAAAPAPAPAAAAPRAGDRTDDGIDEENWLPRKETPAYAAFAHAVETARRDPRAAIDRFVEAANRSSGFYAAWFNAGVAAEAVGDVAAAERYYRQSLTVRPDYGPALVNLSALLARTGRAAEASAVLTTALQKNPEKAGPHVAAATAALASRDLLKAEEEARAAMRYDERNVPAMLVMARVFRAQGRLDTARFAVENALALEPGNALLHLERGHIVLAQQDPKEAILSFERAARLRPTLAEAQEAYGLLLLEQGFPAEAQRAFATLTQLEPRRATAHLHLGNALRANKQYAEAEQAYRKALEIDGTLDEARFNLGVLYIDNALPGIDELTRWQKALQELKAYREHARPDAPTKKRLEDYIESTEKRIAKELKRREREEKRKAAEAATSADAAGAAAPAASPPPSPPAAETVPAEAPPAPAPAAPVPPADTKPDVGNPQKGAVVDDK